MHLEQPGAGFQAIGSQSGTGLTAPDSQGFGPLGSQGAPGNQGLGSQAAGHVALGSQGTRVSARLATRISMARAAMVVHRLLVLLVQCYKSTIQKEGSKVLVQDGEQ